MRVVLGYAKDADGHGVADCRVEAFYEYRTSPAAENPADPPPAGYLVQGRAIAVTGDDGAFAMRFPDTIESRSVRFVASGPSGETVGELDVPTGELGEPVELAVVNAARIVVAATGGAVSQAPPKFVGRVFDIAGRCVPGGLQVVVYATTNPDDQADAAAPVLVTRTDHGGYFTGEHPRASLYRASARVASIPGPVDIVLKDGRLPDPLLLPVDLGELVDVGDGSGEPAGDCSCGSDSCGHDTPRTPDHWDLAHSPSTYSTDLGTGCVTFNVPNRAIDEFQYYTVVRTTEPEIRGVTLGAPDEAAVDQRQQATLALIARLRQGERSKDGLDSPRYRKLLIELLQLLDWADPETTVDQLVTLQDLEELLALATVKVLSARADSLDQPSSRTFLSPTSWVDWDSSPTFYEAASIAHGHILHFKQVWYADGYSLGDLLYSLPLAPGQKRVLSIVDWERREQAARGEQTTVSESLSALLSRDRDLSEVVSGVLSESMRGGSTSSTSGFGAGQGGAGSGSYGSYSFGAVHGVSGGYGQADADAWQDSARAVGSQSLQQLRDTTLQSAAAVRGLRSTAVYTATQGEAVRASTEVVANHNHCHALTVQYFEVLRHLQLALELADVQECLFVPLRMTAFDLAKALRWRESLQPYLRRPELAPAFDAARRVQTEWRDVNTPAGRYADELVTAVVGELQLTIIIPLPPIPPKPPEPPAPDKLLESLSPTSGFLGVLTAIATGGASIIAGEVTKTVTQGARATAEALYNEVGPEAQYARFQRDVMPGVAVGFVDDLELWYRSSGNTLVQLTGVDFTLVSDYQPGQPLLVSVRGTLNNQPKRSDIVSLLVRSSVGLPPGCRVILNTATLRYQTSAFEHSFVTDWRVNDDLELPKYALDIQPTGITVTFRNIEQARGATLYTPIDTWEQTNPRREDQRLSDELVQHLNDGLEYYHNAIWWLMDPNRRFMLLDGFLAPNSGGRSVASVVENRLIGIAGNSLIMPVARGVHLDPRFQPEKANGMLDLTRYYAPASPVPATRVSLPTRGVFAEAVMGSCNACEQTDDTRFWRWEESPIDDVPVLPTTDSRRADLSATTLPTDLPTSVVSIQNAPAAPDPQGLTALLTLLGQQSFRDITGLAATQQNAAAAYKQALDTATEFGKEASKLTQQAAMLRSLDKTMASIDKAEAEKKIKPEDAQRLRTSALEKATGGTDGKLKASDVTERLNLVKKALADDAIDPAAAKGLSSSVLRSFIEGTQQPPAERAAAARLIDELSRGAVTRIETGNPADGVTIIQTAGGPAPAHKTGVGGAVGTTPSPGLSSSISKLIDWTVKLGSAALASEEDKLGDALADAAVDIAKAEFDAATDAIPMARALKMAVRFSLVFAEGAGRLIDVKREEIQRIVDEAASFGDEVTEADKDRMQRARSHLAIGWQQLPDVLNAGFQAVVDEVLASAEGLLAEAAGAVAASATSAISEHLLKALKIDKIMLAAGQAVRDDVPQARRQFYGKLSLKLVRLLISTSAGSKRQRARLEALVPAGGENPAVAILRGLVDIAIADAIHGVLPLSGAFPDDADTVTLTHWAEYEAKAAAHAMIEELKAAGWTFATHAARRGIDVDPATRRIDLPVDTAWELENGPLPPQDGLGLLEDGLTDDEGALATLYDGLDTGILIRAVGYQAVIDAAPAGTWASRLGDATVQCAEDAATATQAFQAAVTALRARYSGTPVEDSARRALLPASFSPASLRPPDPTQPNTLVS